MKTKILLFLFLILNFLKYCYCSVEIQDKDELSLAVSPCGVFDVNYCVKGCKFGTCINNQYCKCDQGYEGTCCNYRIDHNACPYNCNNHGVWSFFEDGQCVCDYGWLEPCCERVCNATTLELLDKKTHLAEILKNENENLEKNLTKCLNKQSLQISKGEYPTILELFQLKNPVCYDFKWNEIGVHGPWWIISKGICLMIRVNIIIVDIVIDYLL